MRFSTLFALALPIFPLTSSQQGFGQVSQSNRVAVKPVCGSKFMTVNLRFHGDNAERFSDWIIVGTSNREQCRLQGTGEMEYIIDIPVMNDPCGTKMLRSGTFENVIRIGKNPLIILDGDEQITIRCVYGPPEVGTPVIPNFVFTDPASVQQPYTIGPPTEPLQDDINERDRNRKKVNVAVIYLIIFPVLFLALIFLLIGCLYFCLKRRKVRLERRKQLLVAPPPGGELGKLGLSHLWWSGKGSVANDALLSHDYMISSNSTREGLSVSTEYGGHSTPSTGSNGSPRHQNSGGGSTPEELPGTSYANHSYAHEMRPDRRQAPPPVNSLQSIPEENKRAKAKPKSYSEWRAQMIAQQQQQANAGPLYAHVDVQKKTNKQASNLDLDTVEMSSAQRLSVNQLSSITEIYATADMADNQHKIEDNASVSTLEGEQYQIEETTVIRADVHAAAIRSALKDRPDWYEPFVQAVEVHRGIGPRKLTEQDISRWRNLLETDRTLQDLLSQCKSAGDFDHITDHADYQQLFTKEKWALITHSLAQTTFVNKLSKILDSQAHAVEENDVKRRYAKRSDGALPRKVKENDINDAEQRIFTRDSYSRVKEDISNNGQLSISMEHDKRRSEADMCTTEVVEETPTIYTPRDPPSQNGTLDTLNVYVGNVPTRQSTKSRKAPPPPVRYDSAVSYGATAYDNWQSNPDEL